MGDILYGKRIHLGVLLNQWTDDKDDVAFQQQKTFSEKTLTMVQSLGFSTPLNSAVVAETQL